MKKTRTALMQSVVHSVEVFALGGLVLFAVYMFRDDADLMAAFKDALRNIIPVVIGAFAGKFVRAHPDIPVGDYVNEA